ncbi:hypothetical protein RJ55_01159 [Drechmeria coniospora]|nr:hypothetical protein RJ55_01159 [Drechmeria coniospora]
MLPRKRQRPNPGDSTSALRRPKPSQSTTSLSQGVSAAEADLALSQRRLPPPAPSTAAQLLGANDHKQVRKAKSWYGSWPKTPDKASPSTSVARENILGGTVRSNKAPDLSRFDQRKADDSASVRSNAAAPLLSKVPENMPLPSRETSSSTREAPEPSTGEDGASSHPPAPANSPPRPSSSWAGWWSTPVADPVQTQPPSAEDCSQRHKEADDGKPGTSSQKQDASAAPHPAPVPPEATAATSWFGFLSSTGPKLDPKPDLPEDVTTDVKDAEDVVMEDAPPPRPTKQAATPTAGSTWAFWSKDSPKKDGKRGEAESGEMAIIGEVSEAHPTPMAEGDVDGSKNQRNKADQAKKKSTWRRKRARPRESMESDTRTPTPTPPHGKVDEGAEPVSQSETESKAPQARTESSTESTSASKLPPNLLLPSFTSTYRMKENPTIVQQIASFILRASPAPPSHVFRVQDPPKVRKAIAIGVHGFFPATYLRPMIGQPTGTSLRFANLCADAIRRWTDAHGCEGCEIEKVALEGEGRIGERVGNLWKLLLNWIDHLRTADLILVASHSQGVPVSVMLLEKLIDLGIVTNARIGVCAMAGVALGPFPDYKSSILMGSAAELWEFGNPESSISQRFESALKHVLDYGARVTFIGSIDDQLVPMESAVYSPASHPYIYRAVFIDGRIHAPDFIAHLVGFALKLRNLGVSDHGLIRELSAPLAGSLYSGEGHSRLYYDDAVYDLAIAHTLETSSMANLAPCDVKPPVARPNNAANPAAANPYVLPWIMRGMLEEDFVRTELSAETEELLRKFDDWKPANKALRDVKYRLEAVRSKL